MLAGSSVSADQNFNAPVGSEGCEAQPTNECYCKYVTYEPKYSCVPRCVEDTIPCCKTCVRMVPETYCVQKCRMVPQYYTETCCRQRPEYYTVPYTKCCKRVVYDQKCDYVARYSWKHNAGDCNVAAPRSFVVPAQDCSNQMQMSAPQGGNFGGGCGPNGCSR